MTRTAKPAAQKPSALAVKPLLTKTVPTGMYASLVKEALEAAERDFQQVLGSGQLLSKAQDKQQEVQELIDAKTTEVMKARQQARDTIFATREFMKIKEQRWAGSCAGARNAASSLETELKTQATAIRAQAADEMAALQKVFAKEVDRILGL